MRAEKTVFIVGAGASKEVGLPVGKELIEIVTGKLNYQIREGSLVPGLGDQDVLDAIQQYARDRQTFSSYLATAQRIREGVIFSNSIDSFLDLHKEDTKIIQVGKLAIAKTILEQEKNSSLYVEYNGTDFKDVEEVKKSWLASFFKGLNDGVGREQVTRIFEKVSFIVFNYDRCNIMLCGRYMELMTRRRPQY
jgi:hypothetical protein